MTGSRLHPAGALVALLLALAASAHSAPASGTSAGARTPRILFGSCGGAFSIRPDGSGLTPVVPRERRLTPLALSRDGRIVAYYSNENASGNIYISRANGTALRRLGHYRGGPLALSRDGRLLALPGSRSGIWIVGTNGRGLRRLTRGRDDSPDWSPDAKALVFLRYSGAGSNIVVQPLRGKSRLLVRGGESAAWSPDGRWIAYSRNGLWLMRPDGAQRHRLVPGVADFAWSPDGRRFAITGHSRRRGYRIGFVHADGRGLKWLRLNVSPALGSSPSWSPDGRRVAFPARLRGDSSESVQLWVVGGNGSGLRRLTAGCGGELWGWTRMAPALPPDPPAERVLGAETVATRDPIQDLSADGSQVAFIAASSPTQCAHVARWTPGTNTLRRLDESKCVVSYGLELAGTRAGWAFVEGCGNSCDVSLYTATFAARSLAKICDLCGTFSPDEDSDFHLHGDGDLLVVNDTLQSNSNTRLVRIGGGTDHCEAGVRSSPAICTTLRRGAHAAPVDSVSTGQIAIRESDEVAVVDSQGAIVREFPFTPDEVSAARLDSGHLVVARVAVIDVYNVATGARLMSQPRPSGFSLSDVDGGIAVLRHGETIMLLRLDDGRSRTFTLGQAPRLAELEPSGLYYSYVDDAEGRVVFVPRSSLF